MSLTPGTRLGPYEITTLLGVGGMGEVYRAIDTNLKRAVAIKVLPNAVAADAERLARFQREAEVLASLNHLHIAGIHGLERSNGATALVMELVEGPTLADRIAQGPMPLDEALPIATQIAEALEAAHEQGIVHRDLKPANIKVRADGTVKVLDFGLAKAIAPVAGSSPGMSQSPTITTPAMTGTGLILGTAAYMSPEQAKGQPADKRADIWAFGCVLFEMLAGRRVFVGEDVAETLAAVIRAEPEWSALPVSTPIAIGRLLRRCLAKDRRQRLADIADARLEIVEPRQAERVVADSTGVAQWRWIGVAVVVGVVAGALGSRSFPTRVSSAAPTTPKVFQIASAPDIEGPSISPDGTHVAYIRGSHLVVRAVDQLEERDVSGTDGASNPFWSPDSRVIGYFVGHELRAVPATGGASRRLTTQNAFAPYGAAWCADGIVFVEFALGLFRIADDGQVRQIAAPQSDADEDNMANPTCARGALFAVVKRRDGPRGDAIVRIHAAGRAELISFPGEEIFGLAFAEPATLLFERRGLSVDIWSIGLDATLSRVAAEPKPVLAESSYPSASLDGSMVALGGVRRADQQLVWVDRQGSTPSVFGRPLQDIRDVAASPDGTRVAVSGQARGQQQPQIWIEHEATAQPFTNEAAGAYSPSWSPKGNQIAYASIATGLFVQSVGAVAGVRLIDNKDRVRNVAWSPDGRFLLYRRGRSSGGIWISNSSGSAEPRLLIRDGDEPAVSPDGRLLAYMSIRSGTREVYVTTFPDARGEWPVSSQGGRHPRWNPRGGELFYAGGARFRADPNSHRELFAVTIAGADTLTVGRPVSLFDAPAKGLTVTGRNDRGYDVAPDGQHFVVRTLGEEGQPFVTFIQNAQALIQRLR